MAALAENIGLLFRFRGDSSDLTRETTKVKGELKSVAAEGQVAGAGLGGGLGAIAGSAAIAATAIAAVTAATVAAVQGLFNLTVSSSEFGSKIYDAQSKTGLSAATLSTLKLAADSAGSSFEEITGSVSKFNVLLGTANAGNEKASDTLKRYGITATDTSEALNQAIVAIAKMSTADERAAAAKELFKDRTAQILPVIEQLNGNLTAATEEAEKYGTAVSDKAVLASDQFGDALTLLKAQAVAAGLAFTTDLMPVLTQYFTSASAWYAQNKGEVASWGSTLASIVSGVGSTFAQAFRGIQENAYALRVALGVVTMGISEMLWQAEKLLLDYFFAKGEANKTLARGNAQEGGGKGLIEGGPDRVRAPGGGGGGGGKSAKSDAEQKAREELQAQIEGQQFVLSQLEKNYKDTMKRIREEFKKSGDSDTFTLAANKANEELSNGANAVLAVLDELERKALKDPTATKSKNLSNKQQKRADDLNILKAEDFEENGELIKAAVQKIFDDLKKIAAENAKDTHDTLIRNAYDEIDAVVGANKKILESEYSTAKQRMAANDAIFAVIKKNAFALNYENNAIRENDVEALNDWRDAKTAEINKTIQDEELRKAALESVNVEYQRRLDLINEIFDKEKAKIDEATAVPVVATPDYNFGIADSWEQFVASIMQDGPTVGQTLETLGQIGMNAFKGMAEGIGSMISAWVLYGSAGPNAMKKMVASVLAGVAAQSAVLAIFELAKGFAALFFNPAEAAAHFHAAALFGSIAVVSAVAGRATAGDSFKQQSSQSTGGPGNSANPGSSSDNDPNAFTTRFRGFTEVNERLTGAIDRLTDVTAQAEETNNKFATRLSGMSPADVLHIGAQENPSAITDALDARLGDDSGVTASLMRQTGLAR